MIDELPWCLCSKGRGEGYTNLGNQFWVHKTCQKPTRLFWENQVLIHRYTQELDEIIERIIEKQEKEDGLDKGRAEMAIKFIAMLQNPSNPNLIGVRDDAVRRYKARKNRS